MVHIVYCDYDRIHGTWRLRALNYHLLSNSIHQLNLSTKSNYSSTLLKEAISSSEVHLLSSY